MTSQKASSGDKKSSNAGKNTSAGGHVGGTYLGQKPDAKTASTRDDKGNKARPNDGKN